MLLKHGPHLVRYRIGNVEQEKVGSSNYLDYPVGTFVTRRLVPTAHDKMTAQANDGLKASWIFEGEQPLRKKGVGCGLHQSDIVTPTVGWIPEASQTLEYGKNYEGYWNGELFIKQV